MKMTRCLACYVVSNCLGLECRQLHSQTGSCVVDERLVQTAAGCTAETELRSVEGLLLVGGDGAVGGGVCHAGQDKAGTHLGVVEEGLVRLVGGSGLDLASA